MEKGNVSDIKSAAYLHGNKNYCIRFENDESEILKRLHSFVLLSHAREVALSIHRDTGSPFQAKASEKKHIQQAKIENSTQEERNNGN